MEAAAMETAAEIRETSADVEQTVAGTEAFKPGVGIVLVLKRIMAGTLLLGAFF